MKLALDGRTASEVQLDSEVSRRGQQIESRRGRRSRAISSADARPRARDRRSSRRGRGAGWASRDGRAELRLGSLAALPDSHAAVRTRPPAASGAATTDVARTSRTARRPLSARVNLSCAAPHVQARAFPGHDRRESHWQAPPPAPSRRRAAGDAVRGVCPRPGRPSYGCICRIGCAAARVRRRQDGENRRKATPDALPTQQIGMIGWLVTIETTAFREPPRALTATGSPRPDPRRRSASAADAQLGSATSPSAHSPPRWA